MMLLQVGTYQCCFVPYIQQSSNYSIIYLFLVDNYLGKWQHISLGKECWIIIQSYHRTLHHIYIYFFFSVNPSYKNWFIWRNWEKNHEFLLEKQPLPIWSSIPWFFFFFFFGKDIFLLYIHDGCHLCCPYGHHILLTRFMTLWMG